jgi:hypothetical protein
MAIYSPTSPYFNTGVTQFYLDLMVNRPVPRSTDDLLIIINSTYEYRPDLLAFDLYGDPSLWWVFYQRNPNTLQAPPLDFKAGIKIYLPQESLLRVELGF